MITCCACGATFAPTGRGYRCPPCRLEYDRAWRAERRAAGLPVSGSRVWDPKKREAWRVAYYADQEVMTRKAAQTRASAARHPGHVSARRQVRSAIESGRLERQPCECCGAQRTHAHHDDYSRPLQVRWLCRKCHDQHHAKAEGRAP